MEIAGATGLGGLWAWHIRVTNLRSGVAYSRDKLALRNSRNKLALRIRLHATNLRCVQGYGIRI